MNRTAAFVLAISAAAAVSLPAIAAYPEKPISVVVPFDAGGGSDVFVRLMQSAIEQNKLMPQPIAVVNVPGGGTAVGSRRVKDAKPDGYELLFNQAALLASQAMGRIDFSYKDLEPIAITGSIYQAIMVRDDSGYNTLKDLMQAATDKPDTIIMAVNMGGINHVAGLLLQGAAPGAKFRFAQVGGGAKAFAALKGGHAQVAAFAGAEIPTYSQQGLKAIASLGAKRDPNHPNLPTATEQGYPAVFETAQMWFAPKGTPPDQIKYLSDVLKRAVESDFMKKKFAEIKMTPVFIGSDQIKPYLDAEYAKLERSLPKGQ